MKGAPYYFLNDARVNENISTIISIYQRLFQYIDDSTKDIDLPTKKDNMITSTQLHDHE
ncbi:hypothetical protein bcgnr5384_28550 [Bacillus cereus]